MAKVVPQRIFSMAIHPSLDKTIVFAGDKWGRLGIWDVVGNLVQLFPANRDFPLHTPDTAQQL